MTLTLPIIYGLLGLFLGSFANVVSLRLHSHKKGILFGRSACPKCDHQLSWYENLPVVSWLCLRGKCKSCKNPISWQYPVAEFFFGFLFFAIAFLTPVEDTWLLIWRLVLTFALGILVLSDLRYMDLPDKVTIPTIGFLLLFAIAGLFTTTSATIPTLVNGLIGASLLYGFLSLFVLLPGIVKSIQTKKIKGALEAITAIFSLPVWILASLLGLGKTFEKYVDNGKDDEEIPTWIGGGDLRLALIMGLTLGCKMGAVAMFLAYMTAAIVIFPLHIFSKKKDSVFPFGPFLILGTFLAMFWGETMLHWYLQLVGIA